MDLKTTYLGFELANPLILGASPLVNDLDTVRRLEDAGIAAVVLHSLFEEDILREISFYREKERHENMFQEAQSFQPETPGYHLGPDQYLELVQRMKGAVSVPVIASLNGATPGGWTDYARKIEQAGADALELNVFLLATDPDETGAEVEERTVRIVRGVCGAVSIPVAVKISPYYSSVTNLARRLEDAGAAGLVLFNRFYQPDIDLEALEIVPNLKLSSSDELRLRLRWLALLWERTQMSMGCTGGAHTAVDVLKAVMAGAHSVQMVSAVLMHGADHVRRTLEAVAFWLTEHEYTSLRQAQGSMSLTRTPNPAALARANYVQLLEAWK